MGTVRRVKRTFAAKPCRDKAAARGSKDERKAGTAFGKDPGRIPGKLGLIPSKGTEAGGAEKSGQGKRRADFQMRPASQGAGTGFGRGDRAAAAVREGIGD